jgi:hypothetical protein
MQERAMKEASQGLGRRVIWALAIAALLMVVRRAESATVVVPNAQTNVEGNSANILPFGCVVTSASMRYQQVYLGPEVGNGTITEIRFRQDAPAVVPFGPNTINGVTIALSSTSAAPDGLSTTFANNIGADVTTVFSGNLTLSSAACGAGPCPFDIVIPLQTTFPFNGGSGPNLLLDVTIPSCVTTTPFDAQNTIGDSVSRANATNSGSSTATTVDSLGLVTQFTGVTTSIPTLSEWAMIGMVLILAGIAVWRLRRRPAFSA